MTESKGKICVLLASYNGEDNIIEQLDSLLLQESDLLVDIVVSVDLSSDSTFELVCHYSELNTRVRVLPYGERFGGAGKNFYRLLKDVELSGYDYIAFCDQDDVWPVDKLDKAIKKLYQYDCYSANVTAFWADGRKKLIDKAQCQREWDYLFEAAGPGCTYVFKTKVANLFKTWLLENYQQVGEDIALHDWLFYAFARSRGYSWFIDPSSMMLYRQHLNNQVGTNTGLTAANKRLKMIKSKWYRNQIIKIAEHLGLLNTPAVRFGIENGYCGNLYLLFNINKVRRRLRDRVAMSLALLFNIF